MGCIFVTSARCREACGRSSFIRKLHAALIAARGPTYLQSALGYLQSALGYLHSAMGTLWDTYRVLWGTYRVQMISGGSITLTEGLM